MRVELFDMHGNLLESVLQKSATAGDFRFDAMKHRFAANMMVIRVSIGQRTASFRFLPFVNGRPPRLGDVMTELAKLQSPQTKGKLDALDG